MLRQIGLMCVVPAMALITGTAFGAANDMTPATSTAGPNANPPYMQQGNDFPTGLVHDWATANAMATRARAVYRQADTDLAVAVRRAQLRFEQSADYQHALTAERDAYNDYTAAREKALASLSNNEKYQAIIHLRDETGAKLSASRMHKAGSETILAMATLKMQYASDARAIEVQLLADNSDVKAARQKMLAASQRVSDMRHELDGAIRDSAEIASARKVLAQARIDMETTDSYAWSAAVAGSNAVYYAYYLHRLDQGYYAPWGPAANVGYGYGGYGTPFWNR